MKKVLSHILACSLLCCLFVGCDSNTNGTDADQDTTVTERAEETTEEETAAQYMATKDPDDIAFLGTEPTAPINKQSFYDNSTEFIVTEYLANDYRMISEDGYSIIGGDKEAENLVLPSEYNGKKIVSVYDETYYESTMKNLIISDSIEYIGWHSFFWCEQLEEISFGKNLKKIGYSAFADCNSLKEIEFNENLKCLDTSSFQGCTGLRKVVFNNELNLIGASSFSGCDSLETLEFKGEYNDLVIGNRAFAYNPNLKKVYLPEGTVEIDAEAFLNCENLQELHIPASVTRFVYNADEENEKQFGKQYVYIESDILRGTDATIYAPKGSAAEQYAEMTGREFVAE